MNPGTRLVVLAWCFTLATWAQPSVASEYAQALDEAEKLFSQGRFQDVVDKLLRWAQKYPERAEARHGLGLAYYQQQDYAGTIEHLSAALKLEPAESVAWRQTVEILGMAHYFSSHWKDAAPLLDKASVWSSGNEDLLNEDLLYALAMSRLYLHERDNARRTFAQLFHFSPDSPQAFILTSDLMYQERFADDAQALLREAQKRWPDWPDISYKLGLIAVAKGDHSAALQCFKAEVARNPSQSLAWHYLGESLFRLAEPNEAVRALQRAVWLNARSVRSYILLAKVHSDQGRFAIAESSLKHAIAIEPQNYEVHYLLGRLYYRTDRGDLAKEQMAIAEKLRNSAEAPK